MSPQIILADIPQNFSHFSKLCFRTYWCCKYNFTFFWYGFTFYKFIKVISKNSCLLHFKCPWFSSGIDAITCELNKCRSHNSNLHFISIRYFSFSFVILVSHALFFSTTSVWNVRCPINIYKWETGRTVCKPSCKSPVILVWFQPKGEFLDTCEQNFRISHLLNILPADRLRRAKLSGPFFVAFPFQRAAEIVFRWHVASVV